MTIEASSPGRLMLYSHIPPGASHGQLHGQYPTSGDAARSQTQPSITSFHDSFELVQYGLETDTLAPMNEGMLRPEMGGIRLPIQSEPEDNKHVELKTLPRLRHAQRPRMEVKKSPITANRDHGYKICPTCGVSGPEQASQQNLDAVDDQPQPADTNGCRVVGEFDTVVPNSSQRTTSLKTIQSHLNQYASENGLPASLFAQHPWERAPDENPMEPSTRLGYDDPAFSPLESYPHSLGISEAAFIMPGSKNGGTSNPPQSSNTALLQAH